METDKPFILAPAGSKASFLAAIAAGADAVYCGLKQYSARMAAKNFAFSELASLTDLAHRKGIQVFIAFNTTIKPEELDQAGAMLMQLKKEINPDGIIVQDLAMVALAKQMNLKSKLHLSTLANVSFPSALTLVKNHPVISRVVLPRELNVDEIKAMAAACPAGVGLEIFVHGALCYGISGRCYWSSYMGGKSGLRGRCVQPCRRRYRIQNTERRYFSCQDLSLDVLVKVLLSIPEIKGWKIEGRKKGPHYVFYAVSAYKMLRDFGNDPQKKKAALEMLSMALGRVSTHYGFLPQRPQNPIQADDQTGSGLLMGYLKGSPDRPYLIPREELLPGDILRVGYEDDDWHVVKKLNQHVPQRGRLVLKIASQKHRLKGVPVFLIDRQEPCLKEIISELETEMADLSGGEKQTRSFQLRNSRCRGQGPAVFDLRVFRTVDAEGNKGQNSAWLSAESVKECSKQKFRGLWWWIPPTIWPENEVALAGMIEIVEKNGGRNFVLNAPWQVTLFAARKKLNLWAGPFCNATNGLAVSEIQSLGFSGVIVSPELGEKDYLDLPGQSPLPLGIVLSGNWPLCTSRTLAQQIKLNEPFVSPRGEVAWAAKHGWDYWIYPNWKLDLSSKREMLLQAGYRCFVHLLEPVPQKIVMKKRPGLWNWAVGMR
jgi:putative protease